MPNRSASVSAYLSSLPAERREALEAVREVIRANLDPVLEEGVQYGMIGYYVPHSVYPDGYHCDPRQPLPFASLASQKHHMAVYLFCLYTDQEVQERFLADWRKTGKKLDMGKSCVRFKKLEDLPLDVLGRAIKRMTAAKFIAAYEAAFAGSKSRRPASSKKRATKAKATKRKATKKAAAKRTPPKQGATGRKVATRRRKKA